MYNSVGQHSLPSGPNSIRRTAGCKDVLLPHVTKRWYYVYGYSMPYDGNWVRLQASICLCCRG